MENGFFADSIPNFYYAILFAATALLTMKNKEPKTHAGTISKFGEELVINDEFNKSIAKYFAQAESLRDIVDYEAFNSVTYEIPFKKKEDCKEFLLETNRIFEK